MIPPHQFHTQKSHTKQASLRFGGHIKQQQIGANFQYICNYIIKYNYILKIRCADWLLVR